MKAYSGVGLQGHHRDMTDVKLAERRRIRTREVTDKGKAYTAFNAHDLLDMDSHGLHGRPGMPY